MQRLTTTQATEQKQRFENFLKSANLVRIGEKFVTLALINATTTNYPEFTLLRRILRKADINSNMLHPELNANYRDILHQYAINAYFKTRNIA
jgi:hypothetical protein